MKLSPSSLDKSLSDMLIPGVHYEDFAVGFEADSLEVLLPFNLEILVGTPQQPDIKNDHYTISWFFLLESLCFRI